MLEQSQEICQKKFIQKIANSNKGKTGLAKTDAQKKDMSEKMKGRIMSEETKRRMSESRKAYWDAKRIC